MPYRITRRSNGMRRRRRTRGRRSTGDSGEKTAMEFARSAYRGVKYLKGLVNSELYKFDQTVTTTVPLGQPALVTNLVPLAEGDGDTNRTGNSVLVKGIYIQGVCTNASTTQPSFSRYVIVKDNQQIGDTVPTWNDVFDSGMVTAPISSATAGRFTILWDNRHVHSISPQTTASRMWRKFVPLKHHVRFNGPLSSDIQKGGLYLMQLTSNAVLSQSLEIRTTYHDN